MSLILKDTQARIDHAFDWTGYLDGQAIAESTWEAAPEEAGGVAVEAAAFDLGRSSARLTGGIAGRVYRVTNRVTLSDGQEDERSLTVRVEER